jgi:hypothetical protein
VCQQAGDLVVIAQPVEDSGFYIEEALCRLKTFGITDLRL